MQQRFHVGFFREFKDALNHKEAMLATTPNKVLQIRKRRGGLSFELVERIAIKTIVLNPEKVTQVRRRDRHGKGNGMNASQNNLV